MFVRVARVLVCMFVLLMVCLFQCLCMLHVGLVVYMCVCWLRMFGAGIVCVTAVCAGMVVVLVGLVLLSCWCVCSKMCVTAVARVFVCVCVCVCILFCVCGCCFCVSESVGACVGMLA